MSRIKLVEDIKKLNSSWDERRKSMKPFNQVDYLVGVVDFRNTAIEELENEMRFAYRNHSTNYTGLSLALQIINKLKYKDNV